MSLSNGNYLLVDEEGRCCCLAVTRARNSKNIEKAHDLANELMKGGDR